ncbi:MAG: LPXTG cell wall anchor domain-containing protein, partial [Clostridia bacterium]|nr:LPXTG cell wall anchor domain-containing protein [Clostridia bacterium]
ERGHLFSLLRRQLPLKGKPFGRDGRYFFLKLMTLPDGEAFWPRSTGGIGTTILYIGGSILVILAAVLLITKRRMSADE